MTDVASELAVDAAEPDDGFRAWITPTPGGGWRVELVEVMFADPHRVKRDSDTLWRHYDITTDRGCRTERGARRVALRMLRKVRERRAREVRTGRIVVRG